MSSSPVASKSCGNPCAYGLGGCVPRMQQPESILWYTAEEACMVADVGDILLFSGHGFATVLAEFFSPSNWSHIGIVCKDANGRPGLIEAVRHADDVPAIGILKASHNSPYIGGVRVVDLKTKLERYRGYAVGIRTLCYKNISELNIVRRHLSEACKYFLHKFHGNPYNQKYFDFVDARFRIRAPVEKEQYETITSASSSNDRAFFCSELVAQILMDAGILSPRYGLASQYLPVDFGQNGGIVLQCPSIEVTKAPQWKPVRFIAIPYAYQNLLDRLFKTGQTQKQQIQQDPPLVSMNPYQVEMLPYTTKAAASSSSSSSSSSFSHYGIEPIPMPLQQGFASSNMFSN